MRTLVLCAAFFVPLAAGAVTLTSTDATIGTTPQIYIGRDACKTRMINFKWDVGSGHPALTEEVDLIKSRNACGTNTTYNSPDNSAAIQNPGQSGTVSVKASELILDSVTDAGMPGGCDNTTRSAVSPWTTHYCVQLRPTGGAPTGTADIPVNFATVSPEAPVKLTIEGGDKHLKVGWTPGDSATIASYDVHVFQADAGIDPAKIATKGVTDTFTDVQKADDGSELQDDVDYAVQVLATDLYGNASALSAPAIGTPKHILDFYNLYRDRGGASTGGGGCSSAGTFTWVAALALAAGLLARRKKKPGAGAALVLGFALLAPAARADWHAAERPARRVLVAFKIDRYDPKVDSEAAFAGLAAEARPYFLVFHGRAPLRYQLEVDWEVAHPFGSILLGGTIGYWQNFGKGLTADTRKPSSDTALLDVIPLGVIATWRFDWLADRWARFPFIPYAQIGLQRALWVSFAGNGSVSKDTVQGGRGSGWTWGYTTALGFALNLDAIDPDLAREAYVDTGIQRTALFAEYGWTRLDGFRSGNALILTDRAWRFGLSMEF